MNVFEVDYFSEIHRMMARDDIGFRQASDYLGATYERLDCSDQRFKFWLIADGLGLVT